jgi:hypothetical protein
MKKKEFKKKRENDKRKQSLSLSCEKKYAKVVKLNRFFQPAFLFVMLIYAVLIFYGYNEIFIDYLLYDIVDIDYTISIALMLSLAFILFMFVSYKFAKFKFLYNFIYVLLSIVLANIGIILFLRNNFTLTNIEIFNIFIYLIFIGFVTSIISFILLKVMIKVRCKKQKGGKNK